MLSRREWNSIGKRTVLRTRLFLLGFKCCVASFTEQQPQPKYEKKRTQRDEMRYEKENPIDLLILPTQVM